MFEKFKSILADDAVYLSLLIIFVATAAFGLGRVSVGLETDAVVVDQGIQIIESSDEFVNTVRIDSGKEDWLVASKSGTRYHLLTCPGAAQIKDSNKIFFNSIDAAKAAGFTPAANCDFE